MSPSSRGPGHRPLTAATRVRIPQGTPDFLDDFSGLVMRRLACSCAPPRVGQAGTGGMSKLCVAPGPLSEWVRRASDGRSDRGVVYSCTSGCKSQPLDIYAGLTGPPHAKLGGCGHVADAIAIRREWGSPARLTPTRPMRFAFKCMITPASFCIHGSPPLFVRGTKP
jgi:hypothetical protein